MRCTIDFAELKINIAKFRANGDKYFDLFNERIPTNLGIDTKILVYKIGNLTTIARIIEKNPAAVYYICDRRCICKGICSVYPLANIESLPIDDQEKYNIFKDKDMKFDLIIMNPPYSRNLHLKVLAKAIQRLKDEKSLCVNLSPVRWLQDPLAKYKKTSDFNKFENNICNHIHNLDIIDAKTIQAIFNNHQYENLAIYVCNTSGGYDYSELMKFTCPVKQKIFNTVILPTYLGKIKSLLDIRTKEGEPDFSRYYVILPMGHGHVGENDYYDMISSKKEIVRRLTITHNGNVGTGIGTANFNTDNEAENFRLSLTTAFIKFCVSMVKTNIRNPYWAIPLMPDYTKPWNTARFCEYFKITPEEQKIIEDTVT